MDAATPGRRQSGPVGGFGELRHFPRVRLALSASRRLPSSAGDLVPPAGWRWALRRELEPLLTGRREPYTSYVSCFELDVTDSDVYRHLETEDVCKFEANLVDLNSVCFLFADSLAAGGYLVRCRSLRYPVSL